MRRHRVVFLAGDGVGPELVAETSRALAELGRLHAFEVAEEHAPFGGDAVRRFGIALPSETVAACRSADAVLVASTKEPALEGVKAALELTWRVQRVLAGAADLEIVSPVGASSEEATVARAFALARRRRARVASVGVSSTWDALVGAAAARNSDVAVEGLSLEVALAALRTAPDRFDVVLTEESLADALSAAAARGAPVVASGRLTDDGHGVFGPTHGSAPDIAGQGVANPSGILLAAALMLGEALGERSAARTLSGAVAGAIAAGALTPDRIEAGAAHTTREFMDVLLAELPGARRDHEFALEVR